MKRLLIALAFAACNAPAASVTPPARPATPVASATANGSRAADQVVVTTRRIEIPRGTHEPLVLELPVIGGLGNAAVEARANALVTAEKLIDASIDSLRDDAKRSAEADQPPLGIQGARYEVAYNAHGLLEIDATHDTMGAYPSSHERRVVIDLRTGNAVSAEAFISSKAPALVKRLESMRAAEVEDSAAERDELAAEIVRVARFTTDHLKNFSINARGVTFHYDYEFPHVIRALQPVGQFFLSWAEIAEYVDPKSPLARAMMSK